MIELRGLEMDYGAVKALRGVSFDIRRGEVLGLIGENGAGKSTLLKILSGTQHPTGGEIALDGKSVRFGSVRDAETAGIVMIHQELNLVPTLSVEDNLVLGNEPVKFLRLNRQQISATADDALAKVGASVPRTARVGDLSVADQQLVEIAKALSKGSEVVIMDEPTAVLAATEVERLLDLVQGLRDAGKTVLYVSHRLDEIKAVCDRVAVLRDGELVGVFPAAELDPTSMAERMVGRKLEALFPEPNQPTGELAYEGFGLKLHRGEIVGLGGLIGSGRTELAEKIRQSKAAVKVAYVSEDRKGTGLHLSLNARENVTLTHLANPLINKSAERETTQSWIDRLQIRISSTETQVGTLSGGNQQKVALAKFLATKPDVLILDEPTRGVDVGAKVEIYKLISEMARDGLAILLISSELNELIGLSHRVLVMREGNLVGEATGQDINEQNLMRMAAGVAA